MITVKLSLVTSVIVYASFKQQMWIFAAASVIGIIVFSYRETVAIAKDQYI